MLLKIMNLTYVLHNCRLSLFNVYTLKELLNVELLSTEIRPPTKGKTPVVVDFNIFVVDINSINVEDMDFR